jgi:hypothetical protein
MQKRGTVDDRTMAAAPSTDGIFQRRFRSSRAGTFTVALTALVCSALPALAQFSQQGPKLVGTYTNGSYPPFQGTTVALSGDGNTLIVGGPDNASSGAAWIFVRNGGTWTQQAKLTAADADTDAGVGASVALSADGNTAVVGGPADGCPNGTVVGCPGATWVFVRNGTTWSQQGEKLIGSGGAECYYEGGYAACAAQGKSVAVSLDGNTLLEGGPGGGGEVWVFTRSNGTWTEQTKFSSTSYNIGATLALSADGNTAITGTTDAALVFTNNDGVWSQQGSALVGTGEVGSNQGTFSVALSADGNTALIGATGDDSFVGAAWVFTRSGGVWSQQGGKLYGNIAQGNDQGKAVALSGDGNTAVIGGPGYQSETGGVWVFTRSGGVWTQQGSVLVGSSATGAAQQGDAVALSRDGHTIAVGGPYDNYNGSSGGYVGAAWVFVTPGAITAATHDFNGDGYSDMLWRDTSGNMAIWEMQGSTIANPSSSGLGGVATTWSIVGQHDFNGDGNADMLWHDTSGNLAIWEMNGTSILNSNSAGLGAVSTVWSVAGVGDFNGDGYADILWRNTTTGDVAIWEMNGTTILNPSSAGVGNVATNWSAVGVGDFNGDGKADILWQNTSNGNLAIYLMNGTTITSSATFANLGAYSVVGIGDFNGDGKSDILLRDTAGDIAIWEMNGTTILNPSSSSVGNLSTVWSVAETGDFNGDGESDILWRDTSGDLAIWEMNGTTISGSAGLGTIPTTFTVQSTGAD